MHTFYRHFLRVLPGILGFTCGAQETSVPRPAWPENLPTATTASAGVEKVISFDNASLSRVFRLLAEQAQINYVEPPLPEDQPISLRFFNLTPREAFDRLAQIRGFKVYERDGIVTLRRPDLQGISYLRVVTYPLRHVDPAWVLQGVAGLLGIPVNAAREVMPTYPKPQDGMLIQGGNRGQGQTGGANGGSTRSTTSTESAKPRWIPSLPLDTPTYVAPSRAGLDPEMVNAIFIDRRDNALVVRANDEAHEMIEDYLRKLDRPEQQILIDTLIVEVDINKSLDQGMDWTRTFGDGVRFTLTPSGQNAASSPAFTTAPPTSGADTRFLLYPQNAILTYPEASAAFQNLARNNNLSTVSQPRVITRAGVPVFIQSTVEQTIEVFQPVQSYGVNQSVQLQTGTESFTTGVTLDVLPRLLEGNKVDLNINPNVSSKVGETLGASGQRLPIISRRSATTTVAVDSGMTVALGGLMQLSDNQASDGIPGLQRIPLLGKYLFSRRNNRQKKTNLIIFVTPTVLEPHHAVEAILPENEKGIVDRARAEETQFKITNRGGKGILTPSAPSNVLTNTVPQASRRLPLVPASPIQAKTNVLSEAPKPPPAGTPEPMEELETMEELEEDLPETPDLDGEPVFPPNNTLEPGITQPGLPKSPAKKEVAVEQRPGTKPASKPYKNNPTAGFRSASGPFNRP